MEDVPSIDIEQIDVSHWRMKEIRRWFPAASKGVVDEQFAVLIESVKYDDKPLTQDFLDGLTPQQYMELIDGVTAAANHLFRA